MEVAAGSGDQDRHGHVTWRLCSDAMYLHTGNIYTVHWYVSKLDNAGVRTQYSHDLVGDKGGRWRRLSYHDNHGHTGCEVCHQISALVIMKDND